MSFKKTGAPDQNDLEIIDFGGDKAAGVFCHKCAKPIGKKSAGLFKSSYSDKPFALSGKIDITCHHCGEKTYAL